jgi:hypothetical protein
MITLESEDHAQEFIDAINTEVTRILNMAKRDGVSQAKEKAPVYNGPVLNRKWAPVPGALRDAITGEVSGKYKIKTYHYSDYFTYSVSGGLKLEIGIPMRDDLFYVGWQETGTRHQKKHPFLKPMILSQAKLTRDRIAEEF